MLGDEQEGACRGTEKRPRKSGGSTDGRPIGKEEGLSANRKQIYGALSVWLPPDVWQPSVLHKRLDTFHDALIGQA